MLEGLVLEAVIRLKKEKEIDIGNVLSRFNDEYPN